MAPVGLRKVSRRGSEAVDGGVGGAALGGVDEAYPVGSTNEPLQMHYG